MIEIILKILIIIILLFYIFFLIFRLMLIKQEEKVIDKAMQELWDSYNQELYYKDWSDYNKRNKRL